MIAVRDAHGWAEPTAAVASPTVETVLEVEIVGEIAPPELPQPVQKTSAPKRVKAKPAKSPKVIRKAVKKPAAKRSKPKRRAAKGVKAKTASKPKLRRGKATKKSPMRAKRPLRKTRTKSRPTARKRASSKKRAR
jgi:hypothetical protein